MSRTRPARALPWLGGLLACYLLYPLGAFLVRLARTGDAGFDAGVFDALWVSVQGATISLLLGALTGVPLARWLAGRRTRLSLAVEVAVQLPLALPPLIGGILLVALVGPATGLGQLSGERLTQTLAGVILAQTFVATPFLVVAARTAFSAVDPALAEVAATLGYGPLARFVRVEIPAAADGIRAGLVLLWLRAFGEYGSTVVLAYHPYTLPVYTDNLFTDSPLSTTDAPTALALGVAVLAVVAARARRPRRRVRPTAVAPAPPPVRPPAAVGFDLAVRTGSFGLRVAHRQATHRLAVLGPSGAGKSLTLRAIAGLLGPGCGDVTIAGLAVGALPPEARRIGYVPQGYGLLPGRAAWGQVTFGVGVDPGRARWWWERLGLDGLEDRQPGELSGGQLQRVSLARALARDPAVVLLDEPFSALDAPVRRDLRRELRRLQLGAGLSTVLVTHDPEDAAALAEEVVLLDAGAVLQRGPFADLARRPASLLAGRLLGIDNLAEADVGPGGVLHAGADRLALDCPLAAGTPVLWQVQPGAVRLGAGAGLELGRGRVLDVIDLGATCEVLVALDGGTELRARVADAPSPGSEVRVAVDPGGVGVWPR